MKNMIELPTEADFHLTSLIDIRESHIAFKKEDGITYKKCVINLRNIIDISEKSFVVNVIDEEKYPIYLEELEKAKGLAKEKPSLYGHIIPEVPSKEIKVTGVLILY